MPNESVQSKTITSRLKRSISKCFASVRSLFFKQCAPDRGFIKWCNGVFETGGGVPGEVSIGLAEFDAKQQGVNEHAVLEMFFEEVNAQLAQGKVVNLSINGKRQQFQNYRPTLDGGEDKTRKKNISRLHITTYSSLHLIGRTLNIGNLLIEGNNVHLSLSDCDIGILTIQGEVKSITLSRVRIGRLTIADNAKIEDMAVTGGCILDIQCPLPWSEKTLFFGSVRIGDDVFFPRKPNQYIMKDSQPLKNFRAQLLKIDNTRSADIVHSAELSMERAIDSDSNKLIGRVYECASDYGSSTSRPINWYFALFAISLMVVGWNGWTVTHLTDVDAAGTWKSILIDKGIVGDIARSSYITFQQSFIPLKLIGDRNLVEPVNVGAFLFLSLYSLLSNIIVVLFLFAVRRRFKMKD